MFLLSINSVTHYPDLLDISTEGVVTVENSWRDQPLVILSNTRPPHSLWIKTSLRLSSSPLGKTTTLLDDEKGSFSVGRKLKELVSALA